MACMNKYPDNKEIHYETARVLFNLTRKEQVYCHISACPNLYGAVGKAMDRYNPYYEPYSRRKGIGRHIFTLYACVLDSLIKESLLNF